MSKTSTHEKFSTGYKQTNLGPLPNTWEAVLLGELFVFKNGLNKAKRFFGSGTPIVNYMDVFERPGLRLAKLSGRVSLTPDEIRNFKVQKGDVFFTRTSEAVRRYWCGIRYAAMDLTIPYLVALFFVPGPVMGDSTIATSSTAFRTELPYLKSYQMQHAQRVCPD